MSEPAVTSDLPLMAGRAERAAIATLRRLLGRTPVQFGATSLSRIEAVVMLDFACESVVRLALRGMNVRVSRRYLPELLGDLVKSIGPRGQPEQLAAIRTLHDVRSGGLHELRAPDETYVQEAMVHATDFVRSVVRVVWDLDLAAVSQVEGIESPRLRTLLLDVEQSLERGDSGRALKGLAVADAEFRLRVRFLRTRRFGRRLSSELRLRGSRVDREVETLLNAIDHRVEETDRDLEALAQEVDQIGFGLSGPDYRWFREVVPVAFGTVNGSWHFTAAEAEPSSMNLYRALQLLLDWIEQAQPIPDLPYREELEPAKKPVNVPPGWPNGPAEQ